MYRIGRQRMWIVKRRSAHPWYVPESSILNPTRCNPDTSITHWQRLALAQFLCRIDVWLLAQNRPSISCLEKAKLCCPSRRIAFKQAGHKTDPRKNAPEPSNGSVSRPQTCAAQPCLQEYP
jgi:hypothetical protein